jgi:hypothetical protein
VIVNFLNGQWRWRSKLRTLEISDITSKFGLHDGEIALTCDPRDDYHVDTLQLAREIISKTERYDMTRTCFYGMSTTHNSFRGEIYRLGGEEEYYCDEPIAVWIDYHTEFEFPVVKDEDLPDCLKAAK